MASKNNFITIDKIKRIGLIHDNVDNKIILACLRRVQDIHLQNILGTCLFEELDKRICDEGGENEDEGVEGVYKTLMDEFIHPFIVAWTDQRVSRYVLTQIRNKTTGKNNDEYINSLSKAEIIAIKDDLTSDADSYGRMLKGYLESNKEDFPLYTDCDCDPKNVQPSKETYTKVFY